VKPPEIYLGANISKIQLPDGCEVWTTCSPKAYVKKNSLLVVEQLLSEDGEGYVLKSKVKNPFLPVTSQKLTLRTSSAPS
jgi:hypothetical protein